MALMIWIHIGSGSVMLMNPFHGILKEIIEMGPYLD